MSGPPVPDTVSAPRSTAYSPQGGSPRKNRDWPTVSCRMRPMRSSAAANSGQLGEPAPRLERDEVGGDFGRHAVEIRVAGQRASAARAAPGGDAQAAQTCVGQEAARLAVLCAWPLGCASKKAGTGQGRQSQKGGGLGAKKGAETGTTRARAAISASPAPSQGRCCRLCFCRLHDRR